MTNTIKTMETRMAYELNLIENLTEEYDFLEDTEENVDDLRILLEEIKDAKALVENYKTAIKAMRELAEWDDRYKEVDFN